MPSDKSNYVNQIRSMWFRLQSSQRLTIIGFGLLGVVFIGVLVYFANKVEYQPLYADLNTEDFQAIESILKEQRKDFIVRGNSILVAAPSVEVDKLRLEIAGFGFARSRKMGYEYFDKGQFEPGSIWRENARLSNRVQELYRDIDRIQNERDDLIKMNENLLKQLQVNSRILEELLNHHSAPYFFLTKQPF
jgi:hypothetical protein